MHTVAVILAGGRGSRLGSSIPKQFLKINGKMIIEYTIEAFQNHDQVNEIVIVCHANHITFLEEQIKNSNYSKVKKILAGGKERHDSSMVAIKHYSVESEYKILFHDAVRPLINEQIITNCITKLDQYNAVGVGIMTTDTIWDVDKGIISTIPNRQSIYRAQTPQGFKLSTIKRAYNIALSSKNIIATDDCGIVSHYLNDETIAVIEGDDKNIKITRREDLLLFENILQS